MSRIKCVRWPPTLPDCVYTTLVYKDIAAASATGGVTAGVYVYKGNGCYDPNLTGVGGQPNRFDEMNAMFQSWRVRWSTIEVRFINNSTSQFLDIGIAAMVPSAALAQSSTYVEQPYAKFKVLGTRGSGREIRYIKAYATTKKIFGMRQHDVSFLGSATADPVNTWHWHIFVQNVDKATAASASLSVKIRYGIEFLNRKAAATSS